jgi:hypothetical protein
MPARGRATSARAARWRDPSGKIVGQDNASNGLAISQQWEVLCPGAFGTPKAAAARPGGAGSTAAAAARPAPPAGAQSVPGAQYAVGETIEAKHGRNWVRRRVTWIRQSGAELDYEVVLDNGQRGILPARMRWLRTSGRCSPSVPAAG